MTIQKFDCREVDCDICPMEWNSEEDVANWPGQEELEEERRKKAFREKINSIGFGRVPGGGRN